MNVEIGNIAVAPNETSPVCVFVVLDVVLGLAEVLSLFHPEDGPEWIALSTIRHTETPKTEKAWEAVRAAMQAAGEVPMD